MLELLLAVAILAGALTIQSSVLIELELILELILQDIAINSKAPITDS